MRTLCSIQTVNAVEPIANADAIERLLREYLGDRQPEENLRAWFSRHTNDELRAHLAGEVLESVERDLPTGRRAWPRHGR